MLFQIFFLCSPDLSGIIQFEEHIVPYVVGSTSDKMYLVFPFLFFRLMTKENKSRNKDLKIGKQRIASFFTTNHSNNQKGKAVGGMKRTLEVLSGITEFEGF